MYRLMGLILACFSLVLAVAASADGHGTDSKRLAQVLDAQPDDRKARYQWRHPQETLEFFGIAPGMTVVEVLPGGGWYSPILVSYLGDEGHLIGADYPFELWSNFPFANEEFLNRRKAWVDTWPKQAEEWRGEDGASAEATRLGEMPADSAGTADAVLFIRALHNLNRFEGKGGYLTTALADTYTVLKPGGVVGVVQHQAPAGRDKAWADGSRGYLNKEVLIGQFEAAGFEYVGESAVNNNPRDVPAEDEIVWRLPPGLSTSRDNPELKAKYEAIGESNRMTLLFRKPTAAPEFLNSGKLLPAELPFSEAVRVGDTLYLSGQVGVVPGTMELVPGGMEAEARQVLRNIELVLTTHGYALADLVKCTVMLADMSEWPAFNTVYSDYLQPPYPARSAFGASGLALGASVEVECIAVK